MRIRWIWAVVAFTLALGGSKAVGQTAADIERDIPNGVLSNQVSAIMLRITQWHEACTARDLEAIEKLHLPGKGRRAKGDLSVMNALLEMQPDWKPSFLAIIWDNKKSQILSQKIMLPGPDCPVTIAWQFEKLDGTWYLSDEVAGGAMPERFRTREDFFAIFDMFVFMPDYPTGHMWFDHPNPKLRFKTNSRKDEVAAFEQTPWPQLDNAPQEVRQIAELAKKWLTAWLADDMEQAGTLCTSRALRSLEADREDNHETLAGTKGQLFSPMAVKIRDSIAEVISHPMQIDLHGTSARVVIRVDLWKVEGQWKIASHRSTQVRGLADSLADFARKYPDSLLWIDDAAPEWLKLDRKEVHLTFDESSIDPLIASLQNGDPEVREAALKLGSQALRADVQRRDEILEVMDELSRDWDHRVRRALANSVFEYWILRQEVQEPLAIEIAMRLSRDMHHHDIRSKAAYALAYVKDKSDEVIMRLVDMVPDWNVDLGRIRRGLQLGTDKEKIRMYLQPYLCLKGRPGDRVKDLYQKIFDEEPPNK